MKRVFTQISIFTLSVWVSLAPNAFANPDAEPSENTVSEEAEVVKDAPAETESPTSDEELEASETVTPADETAEQSATIAEPTSETESVATPSTVQAAPMVPVSNEPPLSRVELRHIPPQFSYDIGIQFGYGELTYWKDEVPAWASLGLAMAWGKHFNGHRIGGGLAFVAEGPIPVHSSFFLEPTVRWDALFGWMQVGLSVGPAVAFHHAERTVVPESYWDVGPVASMRVGWSQPFSRLARRLHVVLEPKVRVVNGQMNPTVGIYVGSGRGY